MVCVQTVDADGLEFIIGGSKRLTNFRNIVGNLSWGTDGQLLSEVFGAYGEVTDSIVLRDRETGIFFNFFLPPLFNPLSIFPT